MIFFDLLFDLIRACRHSRERHAAGLVMRAELDELMDLASLRTSGGRLGPRAYDALIAATALAHQPAAAFPGCSHSICVRTNINDVSSGSWTRRHGSTSSSRHCRCMAGATWRGMPLSSGPPR